MIIKMKMVKFQKTLSDMLDLLDRKRKLACTETFSLLNNTDSNLFIHILTI